MLCALKTASNTVSPTATLGPATYVSISKWEECGKPAFTYRSRLHRALEKAGFTAAERRISWASFAALWHYDIQDCYSGNKHRPECDEAHGTAIHHVLTVTHTEASFGLCVLGRDDGMFMPEDSTEYFEYGAGCSSRQQETGRYRKDIESFI